MKLKIEEHKKKPLTENEEMERENLYLISELRLTNY